MVDKKKKVKKITQEGYKVIDSTKALSKSSKEKLAEIRSLLPPLVNNDNLLDTAALKDFLGIENITSANQGYGISFAGKGLARIKADEPTNKELKIEKERSKNLAETENIIIRGDNLDALKILHQNYYEKIKVIYIDPPYNTDSDGFIYTDRFREDEAALIEKYQIDEEAIDFLDNILGTKSHSGWLYFIYPRLKLARDLLTDDGVIFISIDDNEQANLKLLCDEIWGEENFIQTFTWTKREKTSGVPPKNMIIPNFEYVLCYKKNNDIKFLGQEKSFKSYKKDKDGKFWRTMPIQATGKQDNYFSIIDPKTGKSYYGNWAFSEEKIKRMIHQEKIKFPKTDNGKPNQIVYANKDAASPIFANLGKIDSELSTKALAKLFNGKKAFDFPKPLDLLIKLIKQTTDSDNIILDFFAGSGTTAHAVMELNKEDGGNRKFILIQIDEKIHKTKSKSSYDFCKENNLEPVISSICIERVDRAGEKIKEEADLLDRDLDIGYRVFSLTNRPDLEEKDGQFNLTQVRASTDNTLYNMIAASGGTLLSAQIEEIKKDLLYKINEAYYVLGECKTDLSQFSGRQIYIDGYADIRLQKWLNLVGLDKENITILF